MDFTTTQVNPHIFYGLALLAGLLIHKIPFVKRPFLWFEVFFHELSHGLVAVFTGGSIDRIELHWQGSGACYHRGGWSRLTTLAGYFGGVGFGALIYWAALHIALGEATHIFYGLMGLLAIVTLFWVRNVVTLFIMAVLAGVLYLPMYFQAYDYIALFYMLLGVATTLSGCSAPIDLLYSRGGDGEKLARLTLIPEWVWVVIWLIFGFYALYAMHGWTVSALSS